MQGFKGLKSIIMSVIFSTPDAQGHNVFWEAMRYPGTHPLRPANPSPAAAAAQQTLESGVVDLTLLAAPTAAGVRAALQAKGCRIQQVSRRLLGRSLLPWFSPAPGAVQ